MPTEMKGLADAGTRRTRPNYKIHKTTTVYHAEDRSGSPERRKLKAGDLIEQMAGGYAHFYQVLRLVLVETQRGQPRYLLELEGTCAVCGDPFRFKTRTSVEPYLLRSCPRHRQRRFAFRFAEARRLEQPASERHGRPVDPQMAGTVATCAMLQIMFKKSAAPEDRVEARRLALVGLRTAFLERMTDPDLRRARRLLKETLARRAA